MKINYKKVATIVGSALMIGATAGMAAAASLPSSFTSDLAIVVGSSAADSDNLAALSITNNLLADLAKSGTTTTVTGGDSFKLEKSSTKFHLGNALNSTFSSLDSDELESFLADGSYDDGDIDTDFTQTITLGSATLNLFADTKYNSKEPTVGFNFGSGELVLNYTVDFDDSVNYTEAIQTYMPLFGKDYYVTDASDNKLVLLDAATDTIVSEGESVTVAGYEVSIEYIETGYVKFNVNGESTDKLEEGDVYKLDDGSYIGLTENMWASKDSGVSKAQFSIGSGKITLEDGKEVTVGKDNTRVKGLYAYMTGDDGYMDTLTLKWETSEKTFLTEENPIVMPQFGAITLAFNGLEFSGNSEDISLDNGETLTLSMGNFDMPILWYDGTTYLQGDEDAKLVINTITAANVSNSTYMGGVTKVNSSVISADNVLAVQEDDRFIVTYISSDGDLSDTEQLYYRVDSITADADGTKIDPVVELVSETDSSKTLVLKSVGEDDDHGDVTAKLESLSVDNNTAFISFNRAGSTTGISYNLAISEKGLVVTIPTAADAIAGNALVSFREADDEENINSGIIFQANVSSRDSDTIYAKFLSGNTTAKKEVSDKEYTAYTNGQYGLSTTIMTDESGDTYDYSIKYDGIETPADVQVIGGGATSSVPTTGFLPVKDVDVNTVKGKNLIVIGGSCVNSLAADLLGSACGDSFTSATGVKAGEAIIKSFSYEGKLALLVAGYEALDTTRAATYLGNTGLAAVSGANVKLSTATEATSVIA